MKISIWQKILTGLFVHLFLTEFHHHRLNLSRIEISIIKFEFEGISRQWVIWIMHDFIRLRFKWASMELAQGHVSMELAQDHVSIGLAQDHVSMELAKDHVSMELAQDHVSMELAQDHVSMELAQDHVSMELAQDHVSMELAQDHVSMELAKDHVSMSNSCKFRILQKSRFQFLKSVCSRKPSLRTSFKRCRIWTCVSARRWGCTQEDRGERKKIINENFWCSKPWKSRSSYYKYCLIYFKFNAGKENDVILTSVLQNWPSCKKWRHHQRCFHSEGHDDRHSNLCSPEWSGSVGRTREVQSG